jgi:recombinational DNA repair protein RecT
MVKPEDLSLALDIMIECGLSKEKARQEIGFALQQINSDAKLKVASRGILNEAVCQVGYTGLSLNHLKQESVLVNYQKGKGQGVFFQPMYRGLLKTAISEDAIIAANCQVIFEGDDYEINAGVFKNPVKHVIKSIGKNRTPILTYCVLLLPSGIESLSLLYEDEYNEIKKMGNDGIHQKWGDEMRKKSSLKRALKMVSGTRDSKLDHLIALDNLHYKLDPINNNEPDEIKDKTPKSTKNKSGLPELTETHNHWQGCVKALKEGTHTIETLSDHLYISEDTKTKLIKACTISK